MKRIVSTLLALVLCVSLITPTALAAAPWTGRVTLQWTNQNQGMNNFHRVRNYYMGVYSDVPAGAWYEYNLSTLYEMGLIEGGGAFRPNGHLTLMEVVSLAVRIHSTYMGWIVPAYQSDLEYALSVGIVSPGQYDNYYDYATRRSFAAIMRNALPSEALRGINVVMDNIIPDVPVNSPGGQAIYVLYRAGVLLGSDYRGTYYPNDLITRTSAVVAAARMVEPSLRQGINLYSAEPSGIVMSQATMILNIGESAYLSATVVPDNSWNRTVTWSSSRPWVASVDAGGRVVAVSEGTTVITATARNGVTATCAVGVDVAPYTYSGSGYYKDWLSVPDFGTVTRISPSRVERYDTYSVYYYPMSSVRDSDVISYGERVISAGFRLEQSYTNVQGYRHLVFHKISDQYRKQTVSYGREGNYFVVRPGWVSY